MTTGACAACRLGARDGLSAGARRSVPPHPASARRATAVATQRTARRVIPLLTRLISMTTYRTRRLELTDQTLREWEAVVLDSGPGGIVLDRSAFYPGGGGQP